MFAETVIRKKTPRETGWCKHPVHVLCRAWTAVPYSLHILPVTSEIRKLLLGTSSAGQRYTLYSMSRAGCSILWPVHGVTDYGKRKTLHWWFGWVIDWTAFGYIYLHSVKQRLKSLCSATGIQSYQWEQKHMAHYVSCLDIFLRGLCVETYDGNQNVQISTTFCVASLLTMEGIKSVTTSRGMFNC